METTFQIVSYLPTTDGQFIPNSVKRLSDGELFTIGDFVTNGTPMKGYILSFSLSPQGDDIFVTTDWSKTGMNIDSLKREIEVPSAFAIKQVVQFRIETTEGKHSVANATVRAVHFHHHKDGVVEKYDIDLWFDGGNTSHRIYNVPLTLLNAE